MLQTSPPKNRTRRDLKENKTKELFGGLGWLPRPVALEGDSILSNCQTGRQKKLEKKDTLAVAWSKKKKNRLLGGAKEKKNCPNSNCGKGWGGGRGAGSGPTQAPCRLKNWDPEEGGALVL